MRQLHRTSTHRIEEYINMITTHTTAVCFIAMGTLQNCLNEAALLSIQSYAHITEEYTETVRQRDISH